MPFFRDERESEDDMISLGAFFLAWIFVCGGGQIARAETPSAPPGEIHPIKNFRFAYENLDHFYNSCLSASSCLTDERERGLLRTIRDSLSREGAVDQLKFESGESHPERFFLDGRVRIAVTGSKVGSPIYINTDLLYVPQESGHSLPLSIESAVAILTHELGHHHGILDHNYLDAVGAKVKTFLLKFLQWRKLDPGNQDPERSPIGIQVGLLQWPTPPSSEGMQGAETYFFVADELNHFSLNDLMWNELGQSPHSCPAGGRLEGFRFFDFQWTGWGWPEDDSIGRLPGKKMSARVFFTSKAKIYLRCLYLKEEGEPQSELRTGLHIEFTLFFDHMRENPGDFSYWRLIPEVTEMRLVSKSRF